MDKGTRGLAFLLSVQVQAVIYLAGAWYGAESLNEQFKQSFDWLMVTIPLAILLIFHSFYVVFRFLVTKEKKEK
jgi:hypothetical protein